jgi:hypothetical protein
LEHPVGNSVVRLVAVSMLRGCIGLLFAWFVRQGFVEHSEAQDAASIIAFFIVDRAWEFWQLHRTALYQRWLVALGLDSPADSDPAEIDAAARNAVKQGLRP